MLPYEPIKFPLTSEEYALVTNAKPVELPDYFKQYYANDATMSATYSGSSSSLKTTRYRNSLRNDGMAKLHIVSENSYIVAKNRRAIGGIEAATAVSATAMTTLNNDSLQQNGIAENSALLADVGSVVSNEFDAEMVTEDDEEDDYPKHHLAPGDDVFEEQLATANNKHNLDPYQAYVGGAHGNLADSGGESSETEPFQDDDPNDPEWKGESEERSEKVRRSFKALKQFKIQDTYN